MFFADNYAQTNGIAGAFPVIIKAIYDIIMYFVNYVIQRDFVFKVKKER